MTLLEKAMEIEKENGSGMNIFQIMQNSCPSDYGFKDYECIKDGTAVVCMSCWNIEMPGSELENVKEAFSKVGKAISKASEDAYKEDMHTAYNKGLNDGRNEVWEFLDRIEHAIKSSVLIEVFGYSNIGDILDHFKPQEALAKLKAYEEAQIEVGDVVILDTCPFIEYIVLTVNDNEVYMYSLVPNGTYPLQKFTKKNFGGIKKTGKHIDMPKLLKQIGE